MTSIYRAVIITAFTLAAAHAVWALPIREAVVDSSSGTTVPGLLIQGAAGTVASPGPQLVRNVWNSSLSSSLFTVGGTWSLSNLTCGGSTPTGLGSANATCSGATVTYVNAFGQNVGGFTGGSNILSYSALNLISFTVTNADVFGELANHYRNGQWSFSGTLETPLDPNVAYAVLPTFQARTNFVADAERIGEIPEPSTAILLGSGAGFFWMMRRRRE